MNSLMLQNARILDNSGNEIGKNLWCAGDKIVGIDLATVPAGTEILDAAGGYVIPAFEDAHVHLLQYGAQLNRIGLVEATSLQEALSMIRAGAQTQAGEWILGGEWDKNKWDNPNFPTRWDLDAVTDSRPCAIYGRDLHSLWVNSEALRRMNITEETPDPPCGFIVRDQAGHPTGILLERAMGLLDTVLPVWTVKDAESLIGLAEQQLFSLGIVGVHTNEGLDEFALLDRLRMSGKLRARVTFNFPGTCLDKLRGIGIHSGFGHPDLQVGGLKWFSDGSLGSQTAAMLRPFEGTNSYGAELMSEDEIFSRVKEGIEAGFYSVIHAIGDKANRSILSALTRLNAESKQAGLTHRIEHAQLIDPEDFRYVAGLAAIFSVQPLQALSDIGMINTNWGSRGRWAYPFGTLLNSGATLAFGSDAPVETPNPWLALTVAINRAQSGQDCPDLHREERIGRVPAIQAYTSGSAAACGLSTQRGMVAAGMDADLMILAQNPFDPTVNLEHLRPQVTIRKGTVVFAK